MTDRTGGVPGSGILGRLFGRRRRRVHPDDVDPRHVHAFVDVYDRLPLGGILKGEMMVADQRNGRHGHCEVCGKPAGDPIHATAAGE